MRQGKTNQPMCLFGITRIGEVEDQLAFLYGGGLFDAVFKFECIGAGQGPTGGGQYNGATGTGVFGTLALIVNVDAFGHVGGYPAVQGVIPALGQIDKPSPFRSHLSTLSFNSLPALKKGSFLGGIFTFSPVFGFRPV